MKGYYAKSMVVSRLTGIPYRQNDLVMDAANGRVLIRRHAVESLGLEPLRLKALEPAKHIFTHREWHMEGYEVRVSGWQEFEQDAPDEDGYFVADKEDIDRKWSVPSAFAAFRDKL